jgi:hypothetical protein
VLELGSGLIDRLTKLTADGLQLTYDALILTTWQQGKQVVIGSRIDLLYGHKRPTGFRDEWKKAQSLKKLQAI